MGVWCRQIYKHTTHCAIFIVYTWSSGANFKLCVLSKCTVKAIDLHEYLVPTTCISSFLNKASYVSKCANLFRVMNPSMEIACAAVS